MAARAACRGCARFLGRAAVMPAAAFAVHQLRYLLAYGGAAGLALQRSGHSYLHSLVPWLVLLLAVAVGGFLSAVGRSMAGQTSLPRYGLSLLGLWLTCSACLIAIFVAQESLEGLLATGHPGGLAGIFGYGGWWAIPAALCVGLLLAVVFHGARWVLEEIAVRRSAHMVPVRATPALPRPRAVALRPLAPLALGWCDRGPPR